MVSSKKRFNHLSTGFRQALEWNQNYLSSSNSTEIKPFSYTYFPCHATQKGERKLICIHILQNRNKLDTILSGLTLNRSHLPVPSDPFTQYKKEILDDILVIHILRESHTHAHIAHTRARVRYDYGNIYMKFIHQWMIIFMPYN